MGTQNGTRGIKISLNFMGYNTFLVLSLSIPPVLGCTVSIYIISVRYIPEVNEYY